jgi:uncharacterized protein (TIGR02145 family)
VCWNTTQNPTTANYKTTDGTGAGSFTSNITGLTANTTYYVRAWATNSVNTAYGSEVSFKTSISGGDNGIIFNPNLAYGTMTDIDGNVYKTIQIGTQTWMAENLKTTKYRDGTSIPIEMDSTSWSKLTTGAYCNYNNDANNSIIFGRLYNWYAVNDSRKIAPIGWHIPTYDEWATLANYLGGRSVAGGKLKEIGTSHWKVLNTGATNETGFTALPGGRRTLSNVRNGVFEDLGFSGLWWSSTETMSATAFARDMNYASTDVFIYDSGKSDGYSVRCVKD